MVVYLLDMKNAELKPLSGEHVQAFTTAGRALFTIRSKRTGTRFTFRVKAPKNADEKAPLFVQVLTSPDNDNGYTYLGCIFERSKFVHGKKSTITPEAPSAKAFAWFWTQLQNGKLDQVEVFHHGRCCRCGRTLTVPESIEMGIGPECAQKD